jgi:hypothetical protein
MLKAILSSGAIGVLLSGFVLACSASPGGESDGVNGATAQAATTSPVCDPIGRIPGPGYWWSTSLCEWLPPDSGTCVDKIMCMSGHHWDPYTCKCIKDCDTQMVDCIFGGTWNTITCRCERPCVQTELCVDGDHFDQTLCKCIP